MGSERFERSTIALQSTNEDGHPIAMNMNVVKGFRLTEISPWAKHHLQANSAIISDGLPYFSEIKDANCNLISMITGGEYESVTKTEFAWVNTLIDNVKHSMTGTYHAINPK